MGNINHTEIADGVFLSGTFDGRFKKQRLTAVFVKPLVRSDITETALLSSLLGRGSVNCPDMTLVARKLSMLYGANLTRSAGREGFARSVSVSLEGVCGRYLGNADIEREYADTALETAFEPYMPDGKFPDEWVEIEKEKQRETIAAQYNDKRALCINKTAEAFFGADDPRSLCGAGYDEDLDAIDSARMTEVFCGLRDSARVEIISTGAQVSADMLRGIAPRVPEEIPALSAVPKTETKYIGIPDDVVQQKLAMFYTAGRLLDTDERAALRVATILFGSLPTSRLFMNVREKQSLCYYCSVSPDLRGATIRVDSGIEKGNEVKLESAVQRELRDLQNGNITKKELDETKLFIKNVMLGVNDSVEQLERWYLPQLIRREEPVTPQQVIEQSEAVTAERIAQVLSLFSLNTVGSLVNKE